jgi:hypothetical protein
VRLIRRYGPREPTVAHALLRLLGACASVPGGDPERSAAIDEQARIVIADASREVAQPIDLALAHAEAEAVRRAAAGHPPASRKPGGRPDEPSTHHHRGDPRNNGPGSPGHIRPARGDQAASSQPG